MNWYRQSQRGHPSAVEFLDAFIGIGNADYVREILKRPDAKDFVDVKHFIRAVRSGSVEIIGLILDAGSVDVDAKGGWAIIDTAMRGSLDVFKLLVSRGANISEHGKMALIQANGRKDKDIFKYLKNLMVSANSSVSQHKKAQKIVPSRSAFLHAAIDKQNPEYVRGILAREGSEKMVGDPHFTAAIRTGNIEIIELILDVGFTDVDLNNGWALRNTAQRGMLDVVKFLVERGSDVKKYGRAALYRADARKHWDVIKYLRKLVYPDRKSARSGELEVVKLLVEHGAKPEARDGQAAGLAHSFGHAEVFVYLDNIPETKKAQRDLPTKEDYLEECCYWKKWDYVLALIEGGADPNHLNDLAFRASALYGSYDTVKILLEKYGANVNASIGFALGEVAWQGNFEMVKLLVENGADVNISQEGCNPFIGACKQGYLKIAKYLVEHGADIYAEESSALTGSRHHEDIQDYLLGLMGDQR